jgi:hypothetical protein
VLGTVQWRKLEEIGGVLGPYNPLGDLHTFTVYMPCETVKVVLDGQRGVIEIEASNPRIRSRAPHGIFVSAARLFV